MKQRRPGPPREPWVPPYYSDYDIGTIKALFAGHASEQQQKHALELIVGKIAVKDDQSFRPGGAAGRRDSDFAEGKRFVALQLVKLINMEMPNTAK